MLPAKGSWQGQSTPSDTPLTSPPNPLGGRAAVGLRGGVEPCCNNIIADQAAAMP